MITRLHSIQNSRYVNLPGRICFFLGVLIEVLIVLVDKSELVNPYTGRLFQITFALFAFKLLATEYEIKEYIVIALFFALGLGIDQAGERNEILRAFMFVAACKNVDMRKCLSGVFKLTAAGMGVIALLSLLGIYGKLSVMKEYVGGIFEKRYCFGMGNANSFHLMVLAVM
ncbi:MAG: hypothetical protein HUJ75_02275, partial [Parasporobacterium sp.]|nr:hypothetical protein [Parasporobacterium sp.]